MKKAFVVAAFWALPLWGADTSGTWKLTGEIAGQEISRVCTFRQTDAKLTGTCKSAANEVAVTGEVQGNSVTWQYDVDYEGGKITLVYKGTLDGNTIKGNIDVSGTGGSFSAQRQ